MKAKIFIGMLLLVSSLFVYAEDIVTVEFVKKLKLEALGLEEPSGIAFSEAGNDLWVVSDNSGIVYKVDPESFDVDLEILFVIKEMEGITITPNGRTLYIVEEADNLVIRVDVQDKGISKIKSIEDMDGCTSELRKLLQAGGNNVGVTGIAYHPLHRSLFALKEGPPGVLVQLVPDLEEVEGYRILDEKNGFVDDNLPTAEMDFDGICYDTKLDMFWIVSHKAKRLFLYSWEEDTVKQSFALKFVSNKGQELEIPKAEGIACDPSTGNLYIVCDETGRLYIYSVK